MPTRKADAKWNGSLREGKGELALGSGAWKGPYDFRSRFEDGGAANPEELLGAAHAACFTMAISAALSRENHPPTEVRTTATVTLVAGGGKVDVTRIDLVTRGTVPGITAEQFQAIAEGAKKNCAISKALAVEITLDAQLEG